MLYDTWYIFNNLQCLANGIVYFDELPVIIGSKNEIQSLFQNLLTNSIKFVKKDTPLIIKISALLQNGNWYFRFEDNGIGIEEKELKTIFYIFKRLNNRTQYKYGIGLNNCKKYVEIHKGEIWATSTIKIGTTIHFTLKSNYEN